MEKRKFVSDLNQLKSRCSAVEREQASQLRRRQGSLGREASSIEEYEAKLEADRKLEGQHLNQHLTKVKRGIERFRQSLVTVKSSPQAVNQVKHVMEEVDSSVRQFKERQRKQFEQLLHEEQVLSEAIASMEKKIEAWERQPVALPVNAAKSKPSRSGSKMQQTASDASSSNVPPAVADFQRFLQQTGGHQGGWDDIDHQAFINLRQRFKGREKFNELLAARIAGRSPDDVGSHESWYVEYTMLLERRKAAIEEWKSQKRADRIVVTVDDDATDDGEVDAAREESRKKKSEAERREKKEKVQKWKLEQREQHRKEQLATLEMQQRIAAEQAERLKIERELQQARLGEFKQKKLEEEVMRRDAQEQLKQEEQALRRLATQQLGKFQERDRMALEERRQKQVEQEQKERERAERLNQLKEQVSVQASRDPSRLTKMTAGWEERRKQTVDKGARETRGPMLSVPHRAVPTWRQGV